ncbi:MAG TPA: hypothetical protein VK603_19940, partial [Candidatus Saccharimonadales bacterium]|nr:hypothetical protein [Candidatus Saccharimonadales bacterium]
CTEKIEEPEVAEEIDGPPRATAGEQITAFFAKAKKQLATPVAVPQRQAPRGKFSDKDGAASFNREVGRWHN